MSSLGFKPKYRRPLAFIVVVVALFVVASYVYEIYADSLNSPSQKLFWLQKAELGRPLSPRLHQKIGLLYDQTGDYKKAESELSKPIANTKSRLLLAQTQVHARHFPEALNTLSGLPNSPTKELWLSFAKLGVGDKQRAQGLFNSLSLSPSPLLEDDYNLLGVLLNLPDSKKAAPYAINSKLKSWVDKTGSFASPLSAQLETAELYQSLNFDRSAQKLLAEIIKTQSDYIPAWKLKRTVDHALGPFADEQKDIITIKKADPVYK